MYYVLCLSWSVLYGDTPCYYMAHFTIYVIMTHTINNCISMLEGVDRIVAFHTVWQRSPLNAAVNVRCC